MSTSGAAVDLMVQFRFKVAVFLRLNATPTILSIEKLVKATTQVATSLNTRRWGGVSRLPSPCPRGGQDAPHLQLTRAQLRTDGKAARHVPGHHYLDHRHKVNAVHQRSQGNLG